MNTLRKTIDRITEVLACTILAIMTVLVTWQVITRFVFHSPSTITEALAKYLFVWLVMITAAYVIGKREHMSLEFFVSKFSPRMQQVCNIVSETANFAFMAIVMTYGGGYIAMNAMSQNDSALPIPVGIIYLALPVSGVISMFYAGCNIYDLIKGGKSPFDRQDRLEQMETIEEEIL